MILLAIFAMFGNKFRKKCLYLIEWIFFCQYTFTSLSCVNPLRKIPYFHLISWCANFVKRHSFPIVSGESREIMRKLCLSTKFSHHEIRCNYDILHSDYPSFLEAFLKIFIADFERVFVRWDSSS